MSCISYSSHISAQHSFALFAGAVLQLAMVLIFLIRSPTKELSRILASKTRRFSEAGLTATAFEFVSTSGSEEAYVPQNVQNVSGV